MLLTSLWTPYDFFLSLGFHRKLCFSSNFSCLNPFFYLRFPRMRFIKEVAMAMYNTTVVTHVAGSYNTSDDLLWVFVGYFLYGWCELILSSFAHRCRKMYVF